MALPVFVLDLSFWQEGINLDAGLARMLAGAAHHSPTTAANYAVWMPARQRPSSRKYNRSRKLHRSRAKIPSTSGSARSMR